jgi:hypothetical protein
MLKTDTCLVAATFALALGTTNGNGRTVLSPTARSLIESTTHVLQRIGSSPSHRNGLSVLFAKHIRRIMQSSLSDPEQPATDRPFTSAQSIRTAQNQSAPNAALAIQSSAPSESYVFDMSDEQIIEAINNASNSQELFQLDETMFFDWLDWPNVT